jgi:LysR family cys regulon transcriptional activator
MKLQQLRFLAAVAQSDLNITQAASKLAATQPAISKQLRELEQELGFQLFERHGRSLTKVTAAGEKVLACAERMLVEVKNIKGISAEAKNDQSGSLSIGTTHTQARYVLPPVVSGFRQAYPTAQLHINQGTSEQLADLARTEKIDLVLATGSATLFNGFIRFPCYRWNMKLIVPLTHPLANKRMPTAQDIVKFPIVTYVFSLSGPASLLTPFSEKGLELDIAMTARDADVIKTYVRLGLGVGLIASVAVEPGADSDLRAIDLSHLLPSHTTWIGFPKAALLRGLAYDFLRAFAPHLTPRFVDRVRNAKSPQEAEQLLSATPLPER